MAIIINGNKPSSIIYNGVEATLYFNGNKIWPENIPAGAERYKFRIEGTTNGLITCKYLKCNDVYPDEPYTYKDTLGTDPYYADYMIKGQDGGVYSSGPKAYLWFECTFYFVGPLTSFKYTPMDSKPAGPSTIPDNMTETKITLTNLSTDTVVLTSTFTPSYGTTYTLL